MRYSKYSNIITKQFLEEHYITKQKHVKEIAKELNVNQRTVSGYLKEYNIPIRKYHIVKDMIGKKFGKLTVIKELSIKQANKYIQYECRCDCGNSYIAYGIHLRGGQNNSCGCNRAITRRQKNRKYFIQKILYRNAIIGKSKKLKLDYNIIFEQFIELINKPCFYCGLEHSNRCKDPYMNKQVDFEDHTVFYNGLDRIDSSKGYLIDNVVPCCKFCNRAKSDMTVDEFKTWLGRIYTYYILKDNHV